MKKITSQPITAVTRLAMAVACLYLATACFAGSASDDAKAVPMIDGGIGPCSADFTITGPDGKPFYDAKIKVHIAYRFMNAHKLDLEVGTNADGKARFTGLPEKIKHGFYFYASQGDLQAEAFDDPANNCKAQFALVLKKNP